MTLFWHSRWANLLIPKGWRSSQFSLGKWQLFFGVGREFGLAWGGWRRCERFLDIWSSCSWTLFVRHPRKHSTSSSNDDDDFIFPLFSFVLFIQWNDTIFSLFILFCLSWQFKWTSRLEIGVRVEVKLRSFLGWDERERVCKSNKKL